MRYLIYAACVCLMAGPAAAQDFSVNIKKSIEGYIRPAADGFARAADDLAPAIDAVCRETTAETKAAFAQHYGDVVTTFAKISFLRYGPLLEDDRLNRLAFMPDPRGIAQRQIRKILADTDSTAIDASTLKDKSVAVQGLTALQLIAFDEDGQVVLGDPGEMRDFICGYTRAIAVNAAQVADEVAAAWDDPDGYSSELLMPGEKNDHVRTSKDAIEVIFNALVTGLIIVKDQDVLPALGKGPESAKAHRVPFSRSGNGLVYLASELKGIEDALRAAEFEPLLSEDFAWIPDSIYFEFANAQTLLADITPPIRQSLQDGGNYDRLKVLTLTINSLRDTMAGELAGALSLSGGFNALDGD
ncbi:imelysin family protein [uncultured Roseibium sp.]|uniref:imelysin family protein n=1 Tax=uncultured Roseibium sp. TaxID=1936171 RepID=UPI00321700F8